MAELAAKRTNARTSLAASVLLHLGFVTAAILSLPWRGPPPEPRSLEVTLTALPAPTERIRPRTRPPSARPPLAAVPVAPATAVPAPSAAPAPAMATADPGKIRAILRGSVGCSEETFVHLSQQELDRCAKWRRSQAKPGLEILAPIEANKRAWFDATVAARNAPDHPPMGGCFGKPPPHAIKLGPCYVEPPKGPFSEDVDVPTEPEH